MSRHAVRAAALAALALVLVIAAATTPAADARAPKRIVALSPFSANTLAELGIRPIAIGQSLGGRETFAPELRNVRSLPLAHPSGPNLEQLASLRPGLVLSTPTWRRGNRTMESLDIDVRETEPLSVAQLYGQVRRIASIVERRKAGRRLVGQIRREVERATEGIRRRPRVLLVLGVGRTPYVFLPNSWGGDLVRRAGGRLLTAGARSSSGFARISDETVVAEDPDVIIGVPHARAEDLEGIRRYMQSNQTWQLTSAGQNGRIYVSRDDSLLQADVDAGATITRLRVQFLKNL